MTSDQFQNIVLEKLNGLASKINGLESRIHSLESKTDENTQILKALEHRVEEITASQTAMSEDMHALKGEVTGLNKRIDIIAFSVGNIRRKQNELEADIFTLQDKVGQS